jgi:phosphoribosylformimino-5-aminoimidazole carboxamide ribotide isomerase
MDILPAIDLLDGNVVRLTQGRRDQLTVYSKDPIAMAHRWKAAGARWLHVVDLNGALDGDYVNLPIAEQIIRTAGLQIELSGGIRSQATLEHCLAAGARRIVLGTKACEDPEFVREAAARHGDKIAVAIDARAGQVVSRGWLASTNLTATELARRVLELGVSCLICTDVGRDGMMQGPNLTLLSEVLALKPRELIASGGVSSIDDLKRLKTLDGVTGVIIGKALYEGSIDLPAALRLLDGAAGPAGAAA